MTYKPTYKTSEVFSGIAKISPVNKEGKKYYRVMFTQGKGEEAKTSELYIKLEDAPEYLFNHKTKKMTTNEWRVKLSSNKSKILSAVPSDAIVTAQFHDIAHRENEEPVAFKQTITHKGGSFDVFKFTWLWKVCEGEFEGVEVAHYLNYNFSPVTDDQGHEITEYSSSPVKSPYTAELDNVLTSSGVWEFGPMRWVENLLPIIRKRAIRAREEKDVKVLLTLSNGYIIAVKPVATGWDEEDDYNPEQPKADDVAKAEPEEEVPAEETTTEDDGIPWDDDTE